MTHDARRRVTTRDVALIIGRDPPLEPGSRVLLRLAAITDDELVELAALDERFGDLLRAGTVRVDVDDVVEPVSRLEQVLSTPGQPATGLARSLDSWRLRGFVDMPAAERSNLDRWVDLEHRVVSDYQTIVLVPPGESDDREPTYSTADGDATC